MDWFRLHHKVLHDPRVQTLTPERFKIYINLLCYASQREDNGTVGNVSDVSFAIRETQDAVSSAFHDFEERGLIATDGETFRIPQWKKKQFKSDNSTDRVRKHRAKTKRSETVSVTPPETEQSRTESEEEKEPIGSFSSKEKNKKTKKKRASVAPSGQISDLVFPEDDEAKQRAEHLVAICTRPSCISYFQPFPRKAANGKWLVFAGADWKRDRIDSQFSGRLDAAYGEKQWEFAREGTA